MTPLRIAVLLSRPNRTGGGALVLPMVAFAVFTALLITVVGGARSFWRWHDEQATFYQGLALLAVVLLAVPLVTLGGAAARLSARRRDDRLATLRLLGGTARLVRAITVLESGGVAVLGALAGVALSAAALPAVGLIRFRGEPVGAGRLWLGLPTIGLVVLGVVLLAVVSGALALRRVVLDPLGVRARLIPPPQRWIRLAVGVLVVGGWVLAWRVGSTSIHSALLLVLFFCAGVGACLGVLAVVGPFVVGRTARRGLRRADSPARLLAARTVLEAPRAAWRQVAGVAMTSFVAVFTGVGLAVAQAADGSASNRQLAADIQTGVLFTLLASFTVVACSIGVNQAAAVLDRRDVWVALDRMGVPRAVMHAARAQAVLGPLLLAALGSAAVAAVVVFPVTGYAMVTRPLTVLVDCRLPGRRSRFGGGGPARHPTGADPRPGASAARLSGARARPRGGLVVAVAASRVRRVRSGHDGRPRRPRFAWTRGAWPRCWTRARWRSWC